MSDIWWRIKLHPASDSRNTALCQNAVPPSPMLFLFLRSTHCSYPSELFKNGTTELQIWWYVRRCDSRNNGVLLTHQLCKNTKASQQRLLQAHDFSRWVADDRIELHHLFYWHSLNQRQNSGSKKT